jgi:plasmid stabilization system protein ParE
LERLHGFLAAKDVSTANRAVRIILRELRILERSPQIGRPVPELSQEYRERVIDFGHGGYVVLYYCDGKEVLILAVRHGREADY